MTVMKRRVAKTQDTHQAVIRQKLLTNKKTTTPARAPDFRHKSDGDLYGVLLKPTRTIEKAKRFGGQRALADAQALVATWEQKRTQNPAFQVTLADAKALIVAGLLPAKIADGDDWVALGRAGLSGPTKSLIQGLITSNRFPLDAEAKKRLETIVGLSALSSPDGKLTLTGDQSGSKLRLRGVPGATVEAVNLSAIPSLRVANTEATVLGKVGADGKFDGAFDMRAGDWVRVRLALPDGSRSEWMYVRAEGLGRDMRSVDVNLSRIGLLAKAGDRVSLSNINSSRPISEPFGVLRLVNQRTQSVQTITLNRDGNFDEGLEIAGRAGDTFSVRASDGATDTTFSKEIGKIAVPLTNTNSADPLNLPDPVLHADDVGRFRLVNFTGVAVDAAGASFMDVLQGNIGNCYFPAAIAAIAKFFPNFFEVDKPNSAIRSKVITNPATGQTRTVYEVRFYKPVGFGRFEEVWEAVDTDLYVRSYGGPLYGSDDGPRAPEQMEFWFAIVEKAYAQFKGKQAGIKDGSYDTIGNGGFVDQVFEDLLGRNASSMRVVGSNADVAWRRITSNVDAGLPLGAGTHGKDQAARYTNKGVYANHAYSILGYETVAGVKRVILRNPWGESEPFPGDGKNDGVFSLPIEDFTYLFQSLYYVG